MINKEKFNNLDPEKRIEKLRQLKRKMKKDAVEIDKIITDSEHQLKIDKIAEEVAPELRHIDVSALFDNLEGLEGQLRGTGETAEDKQQGYAPNTGYSDYKPVNARAEEQNIPVDHVGEIINIFRYESETDKVVDAVVASKSVPTKIKRYAGIG